MEANKEWTQEQKIKFAEYCMDKPSYVNLQTLLHDFEKVSMPNKADYIEDKLTTEKENDFIWNDELVKEYAKWYLFSASRITTKLFKELQKENV